MLLLYVVKKNTKYWNSKGETKSNQRNENTNILDILKLIDAIIICCQKRYNNTKNTFTRITSLQYIIWENTNILNYIIYWYHKCFNLGKHK